MTYEEARDYLRKDWTVCDRCDMSENCASCKPIEAKIKVFGALAKQIPKKPIYDDGDYYCAECEEKLETYLYSRCISYCSGCGQAHDWSEVE